MNKAELKELTEIEELEVIPIHTEHSNMFKERKNE